MPLSTTSVELIPTIKDRQQYIKTEIKKEDLLQLRKFIIHQRRWKAEEENSVEF